MLPRRMVVAIGAWSVERCVEVGRQFLAQLPKVKAVWGVEQGGGDRKREREEERESPLCGSLSSTDKFSYCNGAAFTFLALPFSFVAEIVQQ